MQQKVLTQKENARAELKAKINDFIARLTISFVVTFALCAWAINFHLGSINDKFEGFGSGTFGDAFGVVNSLFTGLAFLGVIWSVVMQREDLRETRYQSRVAREELGRSIDILKEQEKNIARQNEATTRQMFETTFFQMFESFNVLVSTLNVHAKAYKYKNPVNGSTTLYEERTKQGKDSFDLYLRLVEEHESRYFLDRISKNLDEIEDNDKRRLLFFKESRSGTVGEFRRPYRLFFSEHGDDLGMYFRNFYTILNFVDQSSIDDNKKPFYCKLIRARMSQAESALVALNTMTKYTTADFNFLLTKYGMAKNGRGGSFLLRKYKRNIADGLFGQSYVRRRNAQGFHPTTLPLGEFNGRALEDMRDWGTLDQGQVLNTLRNM